MNVKWKIGIFVGIVLVCFGFGFCAGYFPQHRKCRVLENQVRECRGGLEVCVQQFGIIRRELSEYRGLAEQLRDNLDESGRIIEHLRRDNRFLDREIRDLRSRSNENRNRIEEYFERYSGAE
ncbi:MAG: hypothetical protein PVG39_01420 [Desulfobacteraceae bacterium]